MSSIVSRDISVINEVVSLDLMFVNIESLLKYFYNIVLDNNLDDSVYLDNIFFGSKSDTSDSSFEIRYRDNVAIMLDKDDSFSTYEKIKQHKRSSIDELAKIDQSGNKIDGCKLVDKVWYNKNLMVKDVFYIRFPETEDIHSLEIPVSIIIEKAPWKNRLFFNKGNYGIHFEELPKEIFDKFKEGVEKYSLSCLIH